MIGTRHQTADGRKLKITGVYRGHGRDDAPGYYYEFDDEPGFTRWISATGAAVRFTKVVDTFSLKRGLLRFFAARERREHADADVKTRA